MEWWYPPVPEWDGLLPPVSCDERPIIDSVRTPVAYSIRHAPHTESDRRCAERVWLARLSGSMGRRNPFSAASKATGLHSGRFYTTTKAHVGRRAKVT